MKTSKSLTILMLALASLIGGGGLLIFMIFLFRGSYNLIDLGMNDFQILIFDAFLCILFFAQHSLMARKPVRQWVTQYLPPIYSGAYYAVASGVAVLILVIFWQETALTLVTVEDTFRTLMRAIFVLAMAGVAWTIWALGLFPNFRLQPMVDDLWDKRSESPLITDRGPYRWSRHPLYLSSLLMIWSNPDLTLDRLFFNFFFSVWVIFAILLEERDLLAAYGEAYRDYQQEVPMLIPWRRLPGFISLDESVTEEN